MLSVATPATAFAVNVPVTPDGVEPMAIDAEDPAMRFPKASWTCTATAGDRATPDVPFAGCTEKPNLLAVPGAIATDELVAFVSPGDAAVNV